MSRRKIIAAQMCAANQRRSRCRRKTSARHGETGPTPPLVPNPTRKARLFRLQILTTMPRAASLKYPLISGMDPAGFRARALGGLRDPLISGMDPAGFRARALGGGWLGHDMTGRDEWTPPRRP